jgi:hypothetical protein
VQEVSQSPVLTTFPDEAVAVAAEPMYEYDLRQLPVVSRKTQSRSSACWIESGCCSPKRFNRCGKPWSWKFPQQRETPAGTDKRGSPMLLLRLQSRAPSC